MAHKVAEFIKHSKFVIAGLAVAVALATAGTVSLLQPQAASAASSACDTVNIIHCGLDGSTLGGYINSLQSFYNKGTDNGNNDLKAVFNWAGASQASITGMTASNTKLGTVYKDGTVKIDGDTVATDAWVSARFNDGAGFTHIEGNVYARKTTTSFAEASSPVIVHYDANGQVDFVVMVDCGNAIKVTPKPVPPKPKPVLSCDLLQVATTSVLRTYTFKASASASNTSVKSYVFNYGDGQSATVTTNDLSAYATHTFAKDNQAYKVTVLVNGTDQSNVTSANCAKVVTTPPAVVQPSLVCSSLVETETPGQALTYTFVARAAAVKTTITSYVYTFGDGTTKTITTSADSSTVAHTYATNNHTYIASVVVNSSDKTNIGSVSCKVNVTTPKPAECKPGVPKGSAACNECKPGVPAGSAACTAAPVTTTTTSSDCSTSNTTVVSGSSNTTNTNINNTCNTTTAAAPTKLADTGPAGVFGIFAGTSALGAVGHRFLLRRRLSRD